MQAKVIYLNGTQGIEDVAEDWFGHAPGERFESDGKFFVFDGVTMISRDTFQVFKEVN